MTTWRVDDDIRRFVSQKVNSDTPFRNWPENVRNSVILTLTEKSHGMYVCSGLVNSKS